MQSSIVLFSLCRIEAAYSQHKNNKSKEIVVFKSHVNSEMFKVCVAYVHLQAKFVACLTKVFLVITMNVEDIQRTSSI